MPQLLKGALQPFSPVDLTVLLAIPTAAVGGLWLASNARSLQRRQVIAMGLWFALAALVALGVLWAPDRGLALRSTAYFGLLATIPLIAALPVAADPSRVERFLFVFVLAGATMLIIATVALVTGNVGGQYIVGANRLSVARAVLFVPLVGMTLLAWHHFGRAQWTLAALASLAIFMAVATGSRAASIGFALVGAAVVVGALTRSAHRGRVLQRVGVLVAGTIFAFVTLSGLLPDGSPARFGLLIDVVGQLVDAPEGEPGDGAPGGDDVLDPDDLDIPVGGSSVAQRGELYRHAMTAFVEHPVTGLGTAGYEAVTRVAYPHNLVLHFAAEFGLAGLILLGAFAARTAMSWRPDSNVSVALGALLAFIMFNAMFSNGIYDNRILWGVWLVVLARPVVEVLAVPTRIDGVEAAAR